ncbi:MAG: amidohydrolase [Proteobacteria bacterium]|nr:amidohydrolase [Pseudomonadota bacterium]
MPRPVQLHTIGLIGYAFALACTSALACTGAPHRTPSGPPSALSDQTSHRQPADLVLVGGDILTMDPERPRARALAIRGELIVAVGDDADIRPLFGPETRVVDLAGRMATPGLVDGHCHLFGLGSALEAVSLEGTKSPADAAKKVAASASGRAAGEWIVGRGWDQTRWPSRQFPHHSVLDAQVPDHPVAVRRIGGHTLWANRAALAIAGITRATRDPPGGRIIRDDSGEPTGVFVDAAMELVEKHIPEPTPAVRRRRILRAAHLAVLHGLTGVHEMGIDDATVAVYRELAASGQLPLRVNAYLSGSAELIASLSQRTPEPDSGTSYFSVRGVKLYSDGALGSRGAALLAPYSDDAQNRGLALLTADQLQNIAEVAASSGWQLAVHAIGDAGNRVVLDAYQAAIERRPGADLRFRVEHAQVVALADLTRFGQLAILASMQPTHATSDMRWAEARLGPERIRGAYAWRAILKSGGRIVAGSDFPVEQVSPLLGIYAAVTRQDRDGNPPRGWYPEQRMTLEEIIHSFTVEAAFAAFVEHRRGQLRPGYAADITVYDRVLTGDRSLLDTHIDSTIVGGRIAYERKIERP